MCGVGIYCHPNGDRFEGMFFGNKPDGPGSFYERDHYTGNHTGNHAIWQGGRKVKDTNFPFVPTSADLPDHDGKVRDYFFIIWFFIVLNFISGNSRTSIYIYIYI